MKYCANCGNQMNDSVKFCPKCGKQAEQVQQVRPISNVVSNSQASVKRNGDISPVLDKIRLFIILGMILVIIFQLTALGSKMPDSNNTYFEELLDAMHILVLLIAFSLGTFLFSGMKKDFGIVSLICSIVSCVLVSLILNAVIMDWVGDEYSYYNKEMIKLELLEEGGAFGYYTLSITRVLLIIASAVNCIINIIQALAGKKYTVDNDYDDNWVCPSCGMVNSVRVKICGCGYSGEELMKKTNNMYK